MQGAKESLKWVHHDFTPLDRDSGDRRGTREADSCFHVKREDTNFAAPGDLQSIAELTDKLGTRPQKRRNVPPVHPLLLLCVLTDIRMKRADNWMSPPLRMNPKVLDVEALPFRLNSSATLKTDATTHGKQSEGGELLAAHPLLSRRHFRV